MQHKFHLDRWVAWSHVRHGDQLFNDILVVGKIREFAFIQLYLVYSRDHDRDTLMDLAREVLKNSAAAQELLAGLLPLSVQKPQQIIVPPRVQHDENSSTANT